MNKILFGRSLAVLLITFAAACSSRQHLEISVTSGEQNTLASAPISVHFRNSGRDPIKIITPILHLNLILHIVSSDGRVIPYRGGVPYIEWSSDAVTVIEPGDKYEFVVDLMGPSAGEFAFGELDAGASDQVREEHQALVQRLKARTLYGIKQPGTYEVSAHFYLGEKFQGDRPFKVSEGIWRGEIRSVPIQINISDK